jgi:hypothetical protein
VFVTEELLHQAMWVDGDVLAANTCRKSQLTQARPTVFGDSHELFGDVIGRTVASGQGPVQTPDTSEIRDGVRILESRDW